MCLVVIYGHTSDQDAVVRLGSILRSILRSNTSVTIGPDLYLKETRVIQTRIA